VPNNIAEGFERGTTQELITFLYYARGSAGEVRSILAVAERLEALGDFRSQIADLKRKAESISRQLAAWINSLKETSIRGDRYLTEAARKKQDREKAAQEFLRELRQNFDPARNRPVVQEPPAGTHNHTNPGAHSEQTTSARQESATGKATQAPSADTQLEPSADTSPHPPPASTHQQPSTGNLPPAPEPRSEI
jgi:hypothetical protein